MMPEIATKNPAQVMARKNSSKIENSPPPSIIFLMVRPSVMREVQMNVFTLITHIDTNARQTTDSYGIFL